MNLTEARRIIEESEGKACCVRWVPNGDYDLMRDLVCCIAKGKVYEISMQMSDGEARVHVSLVKEEDINEINISGASIFLNHEEVIFSGLLSDRKIRQVNVVADVVYD